MHIDKPIVIALILLIILVLVFVLVKPEYENFKELQTQLGIKKAEYNAEFDYYSEISRNYAQLQSRSDEVKKIDAALPSDPVLGKLVYFMQEKASESGLILKSLFLTKSSGSSTENTVKDLAFSLSLTGNYSALKTFISYLENSVKVFEVKSINFGSADVSDEELQLLSESIYSFSIQVNTYIY